MNFKNEKYYPLYVNYLGTKSLSNGAYKLALISSDLYNQFVDRYTNEPFFRQKQDSISKSIQRDEKLGQILEDFEIETEGGEKTSIQRDQDDDFFDF